MLYQIIIYIKHNKATEWSWGENSNKKKHASVKNLILLGVEDSPVRKSTLVPYLTSKCMFVVIWLQINF